MKRFGQILKDFFTKNIVIKVIAFALALVTVFLINIT